MPIDIMILKKFFCTRNYWNILFLLANKEMSTCTLYNGNFIFKL